MAMELIWGTLYVDELGSATWVVLLSLPVFMGCVVKLASTYYGYAVELGNVICGICY